MASDDDDGYTPREPLTPLYNPSSGNPPSGAAQPGRSPRHGPLGARLSQRGRATQPPADGAQPYSPYSPYSFSAPESGELPPASGGDYVPSSPPSPTWGRVTGLLKLDDKVTGALHADLQFGATWSSRSEMLRACLDEYYRLVASYNEARRLLDLSGGDIDALRREQTAANSRLREVESRLEFHSRTELRAVYLGAAEIEARLFRAEEERDLLRSRTELLEGFMAFLSRIIATVRAIPPNVVIGGDAPAAAASGATGAPTTPGAPNIPGAPNATGASGAAPRLPAGAHPDETLLYNGAREHHPSLPAARTPGEPPRAAPPTHEIEELVLDERDVALLASSEFEIIEILDENESAASEGGAPETAASDGIAGSGPNGEAPKAPGDMGR